MSCFVNMGSRYPILKFKLITVMEAFSRSFFAEFGKRGVTNGFGKVEDFYCLNFSQ